MNRTLFLFVAFATILACSRTSAQTINVCALLGIPNATYQSTSDSVCTGPSTSAPFGSVVIPTLMARGTMNTELAGHTLVELRNLIAEIKALRGDLKDHAKNLTDARTRFDTSTQATTGAQEAWRKEALNKVIEDLKKVPVLLAADPSLQTALQSKLKTDLADDAAFIAAVRAALSK